MKPVFALLSTLLLGASKVWLWGCVGGRYQWFSPPMLRLISWNQGHNHAITIISNEFHKLWCLFDLRNNIFKFDPKRTCLNQKARVRPTGILTVESWHETLPKSSRGRIQANPMGSFPEHTSWNRKAWTHMQNGGILAMIREQDNYPSMSTLRPLRSMSVQRRAEMPPEPGRLA